MRKVDSASGFQTAPTQSFKKASEAKDDKSVFISWLFLEKTSKCGFGPDFMQMRGKSTCNLFCANNSKETYVQKLISNTTLSINFSVGPVEPEAHEFTILAWCDGSDQGTSSSVL